MKNSDKDFLRKRVAHEIALEHDMLTTVSRVKVYGFKPATIKKYYKALSS